jgi:hypothetical protein
MSGPPCLPSSLPSLRPARARTWDQLITPGSEAMGDITLMCKGAMEVFRAGNPTLFYELYPVPEVSSSSIRGIPL